MKKTILALLAIAALGTSTAVAQFSVGPKAMLNLANIGGDAEGDMRIAAAFGGSAEYKLSDKLGLGADVLYSMQGATDEVEVVGGSNLDATYRLDYINIPLYAKFYPVADLGLYVAGGLQPSFALTRELEIDGNTTDQADDYKGFDLAIPLGVGFKLDMGLAFDARFNLGLTDIYEPENDLIEDQNFSNQVIQIGATYFFEL